MDLGQGWNIFIARISGTPRCFHQGVDGRFRQSFYDGMTGEHCICSSTARRCLSLSPRRELAATHVAKISPRKKPRRKSLSPIRIAPGRSSCSSRTSSRAHSADISGVVLPRVSKMPLMVAYHVLLLENLLVQRSGIPYFHGHERSFHGPCSPVFAET